MSDDLRVHLEALSRYADAVEDLAERFGAVRRLLADADVTEDSFGLLSESREAGRVYRERCTDGLDVLRAGEDVFGDLAVGFRQMRDNYRAADAVSSQRLEGTR
jgi:predicted kinase